MAGPEDVKITRVPRLHALERVPSDEPVNIELLENLLKSLKQEERSDSPPEKKCDSEKSTPLPRNVQERLRGLSPTEQRKIAATGRQSERVALERMYGKSVWETLLHNPRLTPPEAARIGRMPNLPKPLLERITNNRAWLSSPQVRRALLSNHRLARNLVILVLRATPKSELKLIPKQLSYPALVRDVAAKMKQ